MKRLGKRLTAVTLSAVIAMSSTGCGAVTGVLDRFGIKVPGLTGSKTENAAAADTAAAGATNLNAEQASAEEPAAEPLSPEEERRRSEGKHLNICCWDESLESLFIMYYPGYEDLGDRTGRIGDVIVNWVIPEDGRYMDMVAEKLLGAEYLGHDERIDLYLAPEEDLAVYVNSDYSLDVREKVGLTDEELEDQFAYTQQMASTDEGILKAVTWQATPGVFVYRRSIAKEVLGTDDPDAVQKFVADWKTFTTTAAKMKKNKYYMVSGYFDAYSAYRYGADRHWVNDGNFVIPSVFTEWKDMMKTFNKKKYHRGTVIGDDRWVADQGPNGKVFGFFRAITDIDSKMAAYSLADGDLAPAAGNGVYGDYAVCCGPQPFCRGGVWILAAPSSDNLILDKEIMENLTCNSNLLYKIAQKENIFTNTITGMRKMASGENSDPFLDGQNPYEVYYESASRLNVLPAGSYDRKMADSFRDYMLKFFTGKMEEDEAIDKYYEMVEREYPELNVDY